MHITEVRNMWVIFVHSATNIFKIVFLLTWELKAHAKTERQLNQKKLVGSLPPPCGS